MKCPGCGTPQSRVFKTQDDEVTASRQRRCPCGGRWYTDERVRRGSFVVVPGTAMAISEPLVTSNGHKQPPIAAADRPHTRASESEVSVSSQNPSLPLVDQSQTPARVSTEYHSAFLVEWNQTTKTGSKFNAQKAWNALGRPAFGASWGRWSQLDGWRRGFVPHVATWLNDRRFEQTPFEAPRQTNGAKGAGTMDALTDFMLRGERSAG